MRFYKTSAMLPIEENRETMSRIDLPQGTLDLLILRTLSLEPQHGWGISGTAQESERLPERLVFSEKGFWLA